MDDLRRRHSKLRRRAAVIFSLLNACCLSTCSKGDVEVPAAISATRPNETLPNETLPNETLPNETRPNGMFVDVAVDAGLTREHVGGGPDKGYIVEAKGGGAALLDFDDDGDLDIYWVNGAALADPDRGAGNALYRNDKGVFVDVAEVHGVQGRGWGMGAVSADYDNDGDADLCVTNLQANILYRSDGSGRGFTDITSAAGVATPHWSTGAAFADYDGDGDVDLYVASYAALDTIDVAPLGSRWKGVAAFVGPLGLRPVADVLYRNEGDDRFLEVSADAGVSQSEPGYGFAVLFADYDSDGDPDLYVANDSSPNFMFRNEGSGRFSDQSMQVNAAFGESGVSQAGMGASWGDYDGDGFADIFVTNFEDDYNTLYHNDGGGHFSDVSFDVGLARPSLNYVGFGTSFADFDNDADLDLFVANGHVYPAIGSGGTGATYAEADHLYENLGDGGFALHANPGQVFSTARVSRGSCVGDFDNDGDLDIFVSNLNDRPVLLRNDAGHRNNWVGLQLRGTVSNRDAIGAHVQLFAGGRRQVRDILCGSSFLSSEDRRVHFGLGETAVVDSVEVRWPSGALQHLADVSVNRYTLIEEADHSAMTATDSDDDAGTDPARRVDDGPGQRAPGPTISPVIGIDWTPVGPGGGGAQYSPAIAPNNPGLMYGMCDMGGFYRSKDGGRTWRMYETTEIGRPVTYHPVHCNPAFDPFDETIAFAGMRSGLARTTDGGESWRYLSKDAPTAIALNRAETRIAIYASSDGRLHLTRDRGESWAELPAWREAVGEIAIDLFIDASSPLDRLSLFAATSSGMFRTGDGGESWSAVNTGLPSTGIWDFNGAMKGGSPILFATLTDGNLGVFRSSDGGESWSAVNSGLNLTDSSRRELGICDSQPEVLYLGVEESRYRTPIGTMESGPTIYKTTDGGENWSVVLTDPSRGNLPPGVAVARDWLTLAYGWWWQGTPTEVMVSPSDPDHVAFSTGATWRSDDGGQSWFCANTRETGRGSNWWTSVGFETTTNYRVHFAPWHHDRVYITYTDIALFRSEDRGYSWRQSAVGSEWHNTFYDIAFDPTIAGKLWAVASNDHDIPHEKMLVLDRFPNLSGGVLVSTDYGATWTDLGHATGLPEGAPTSIAVDPRSPEGSRTLYVAVIGHGVYKSTDDGKSWRAVNSGLGTPDNTNVHLLKRMDDGTLYCSITMASSPGRRQRRPGGLFKSTDGGETWTHISASRTLPYICGFDVDANDQDRVYVASMAMPGQDGGGLFKTTDGGETWRRTLDLGATYGADIDPEVPSRVYATLNHGEASQPEGGVYMSEDYGETWSKLGGFPFESFGPNYVSFDPDDSQEIYVTTFGGGVWKARIPHRE